MIVSDYRVTIMDAAAADVIAAFSQLAAVRSFALGADGLVTFTAIGYPTRVQALVNQSLPDAVCDWPRRIYESTLIEAD